MHSHARQDGATALGLLAGFLILFIATLCPTVYFGDSGEIATAIYTGGVIHPPGYPLFALLGRAALWLIPFGEPALRIGCVTAAAAAGGVSVLFLLCRRLGALWPAALSAAMLFGFSQTFWGQSVRVEVYSLHVLLALSALLFILRYRESAKEKELFCACLMVSLGIAHHLTIVLLLPGLLWLAWPHLWQKAGLARRLGVGVAILALIGPLFYLLLPLWARDSAHNWGNPSTPYNLWTHATAKLYRDLLEPPTSIVRLTSATGTLSGVVSANLPLMLWVGALAGAFFLGKRERVLAGALGLSALILTGYNFCYRIPDIAGYYLVPLALLACFLAAALDTLLRHAPRQRIVAAGLLALPLLLAARNFPRCNLRQATLVREFAIQKLEHCDRGSVLITQGDQDDFPVLYAHDVLGVRPDVLQVNRAFVTWAFSYQDVDPTQWFLRRLRARGVETPAVSVQSAAERKHWAEDGYLMLLLDGPLKDRPLAVTFLRTPTDPARDPYRILPWLLERYAPMPQGLILQLHPRKAQPTLARSLEKNRQIWDTLTLPSVNLDTTGDELDPIYLSRHYAAMLINYGFLYEKAGDAGRAAGVYTLARDWSPELVGPILKELSPRSPVAARLLTEARTARR